ncbi:MAG: hypothetical protein M4579_002559 [Chaenotheca gracillima]|nr:MAG: hypothetical protein M4579_002559 [Chaenotheca gracillima]
MANDKLTTPSTTASERLTKVTDFLTFQKTATTIPFDPDSTKFPSRKDVPRIEGAPEEAAWVWGKDDYLGRINLLTPTRVLAASKEIKTGEMVPLNLPLDVPKVPGFHREQFQHEIKNLVPGVAFDDIYHLNTQSGSQWDGFRHIAHMHSKYFYNHTTESDIVGPEANGKAGIDYLSKHGIAARGLLLDYRSYALKKGIEYDPWDYYAISWDELYACGKYQGIDIRPAAQGGDVKIGDILMIRSGFVSTYDEKPASERERLAQREGAVGPDSNQRWAGVKQEEKMKDWLHDCYFAAVAGDAVSFEAWPSFEPYYLHEYLLALWGCPIGELFDLETLADKCRERNRWTFFVTSSPANVPECDYNIHKSNSTYFTDLDISRLHLVTTLMKGGIDKMAKQRKGTSKGKFGIMLGGVACTFKREIQPYQAYDIWSRVMCWDRKWIYIVSHFVEKGSAKPAAYTLQPWMNPKGATKSRAQSSDKPIGDNAGDETSEKSPSPRSNSKIFAIGTAKYVIKEGRMTVPPERFLELCGLLPPRPSNASSPSGTTSPSLESSAVDVGAASTYSNMTRSAAERILDSTLDPSGTDDGEWSWERIEEERKKGIRILEAMEGLDALQDAFTGSGSVALGRYTDLL